jgi:hypothetical protein
MILLNAFLVIASLFVAVEASDSYIDFCKMVKEHEQLTGGQISR